MNVGKHRIAVEQTRRGPRCSVCHVPLRQDGNGYYHSPGRIYAAIHQQDTDRAAR